MTSRDDRALRRQLERYELRFNPAFWEFWDERIAPTLPPAPVIADIGPGPGLFLRDLSARLPDAHLYGVDSNEAMIENARSLDYAGPVPTLSLLDVEANPLPFDDVSETSYARGDIGCLIALEVTNGTSATTYSPDLHMSVTRPMTIMQVQEGKHSAIGVFRPTKAASIVF